MICLGITGGIGTGKSECAAQLGRLGIRVLDTDDVARALVEPGQPALAEIIEAFGPSVVEGSGRLDRAVLGTRVFSEAAARERLESILHPRIFAEWTRWIAGCRECHGVRVVAVVIPLLYEKGYAGHFDAVAAIACSTDTQRRRLRARGWSDRVIDGRLAAQWPMPEKFRKADFGLWSEGCLEVLHQQVQAVLESLAA
jgi:dephospho-CoA kinase